MPEKNETDALVAERLRLSRLMRRFHIRPSDAVRYCADGRSIGHPRFCNLRDTARIALNLVSGIRPGIEQLATLAGWDGTWEEIDATEDDQ